MHEDGCKPDAAAQSTTRAVGTYSHIDPIVSVSVLYIHSDCILQYEMLPQQLLLLLLLFLLLVLGGQVSIARNDSGPT